MLPMITGYCRSRGLEFSKASLVVCLAKCYAHTVSTSTNPTQSASAASAPVAPSAPAEPAPAAHTAPDALEALTLATDIRALFGKLKRRLREQAGAAELTPSQAAVLSQLERNGPSTVTELAQAEGVRPQSMGATVAALEAAGFVTGSPDPNDGRRTFLSISEMAIEKFAANRAARESWLFRAIQENLTQQEQRDLARGVELLSKLVDSP
jgi:DNA-binding MarR family transcriptional regulator